MTTRYFLLAANLAVLCAAVFASADEKKGPEPAKPPTQEQIKTWMKKLEEPTRYYLDPKEGPPDDGIGPSFDFRIHSGIVELARAREVAQPAVFALLADQKKPGQARASAAMVVLEWLLGKGAKQEPNPELLKVIQAALKEKEPALKWGILRWAERYGAHSNRSSRADLSDDEYKKEFGVSRDSGYFSDAAMDGLLPEIITLLTDEEPKIAAKAAVVIASFGRPKQGVKELIAALDRREESIRVAAVYALGIVGTDDPKALKAVLGQLKPEHYPQHYSGVVEAVGRFGPKAKDAVPALIEVLKKSEWKRREFMFPEEEAIRTLGNIGPEAKAAIPWMLKYAECCTRDWSRLIKALDQIDPEAGKQARAIQKQIMDGRTQSNKP